MKVPKRILKKIALKMSFYFTVLAMLVNISSPALYTVALAVENKEAQKEVVEEFKEEPKEEVEKEEEEAEEEIPVEEEEAEEPEEEISEESLQNEETEDPAEESEETLENKKNDDLGDTEEVVENPIGEGSDEAEEEIAEETDSQEEDQAEEEKSEKKGEPSEEADSSWAEEAEEKGYEVFEVKEGEKYEYKETGLSINFIHIDGDVSEENRVIGIKEVELTDEQVEAFKALSNTAYDIISPMENGDFEYELVLPASEDTNEEDVEVLFAEDEEELNDTEKVKNQKVEKNNVSVEEKDSNKKEVKAEKLNHLTIFVVVGTKTQEFSEADDAVVINEFVFDPASGDPEWVELYNKSDSIIDLEGWTLKDEADNNLKTFSAGETIQAKDLLVIEMSNKLNNSDGDVITLRDDFDSVISRVTYDDSDSGFSIGGEEQNIGEVNSGESVARIEDGGTDWAVAENPTKESSNEVADDSIIYVDASNSGDSEEDGSEAHPFDTIQEAIDDAEAGDTINVDAGTYVENIVIDVPNLTLQSVNGRENTIIDNPSVGSETSGIYVWSNLGTVTVDGFTANNFRNGIIQSYTKSEGTSFIVKNSKVIPENYGTDDVYLRNGIQVSGDGSQIIDNIVVGAPLTEDWSSSSIGVVNASNVLVRGNVVSGSADIGIDINNYNSALVDNITINNNQISGAKSGVTMEASSSNLTPNIQNIVITNNTLENSQVEGQGINVERVTLTNLTVTGNEITGNDYAGIRFFETSATLAGDILINNNNLSNNTDYGIFNGVSYSVNAVNNWWGSENPDFETIVSENVDYDPWYVNSEMTIFSDAVSNDGGTVTVPDGEEDLILGSDDNGDASLPGGVTDIVLDDDSGLDLSAGLSGGEVILKSGTSGEPITLTNSGLSGVSASIPDGTKITGSAGWDGVIIPPTLGESTGNAPAGFSVGDVVISIGSTTETLTFDKPITLILAGVTGTVGYKPAGSNDWTKITNACGEDYANPTFVADECSINNGTDTKILTNHFTDFGELDDKTPPPVPTLVAPADNSYLSSHTFTADWGDVVDNESGLLNYDIEFYYGGSWRDLRTVIASQRTNSASYDLTWQWHVRARDNAGNVSDWSDPWTVNLDTASPVMSNYGISDTLLNASENTISLSGDISDTASPIDSVKYSIWDSTKTILYANWTEANALDGSYDSKDESTSHNIDVSSYPDDTFVLGVRGWDKAGNKASGGDFYFTVDNTAPTATITYSPTSLTSTDVVATLNPSETVTVTNNSGSTDYTFTANGSFPFEFEDEAGNTGTALAEVDYIDKEAPVIAMNGSVDVTVAQGSTYTDAGATCTDNYDGSCSVVTVNNVDTSVLGDYTVTYDATDNAGNSATQAVRTVHVTDQTAPSITFDEPTTDSIKSGVVHLKATCNEDCDYVNFWWRNDGESYDPSDKQYHYVRDNGTNFEWDLDTLGAEKADGTNYTMDDGVYYLYAAGKDLAGNWARTAGEVKIVVDNTPPSIPSIDFTAGGMDVLNDGFTNSENFTFNLSSDDAIRYQLKYWNSIPGDTYNGEKNAWNPKNKTSSYSDHFSRGEGMHHFRFSACDLAGNCSAYSDVFNVTYDNTAPTATITYSLSSLTNTDVVATLVPNETVTVTNNSGSTDYTFTANGSFPFEFEDEAGNTGTALAEVDYIDKEAPVLASKTTGFSGWYNSSQTSVFEYTDDNMLGDYSDPFCDITTEGANQTCDITPNVCDEAGNCNTDTVTSNEVNLDFTNPESVITYPVPEPGEDVVYSSDWDGTLAGTASDNLSNVEKVELEIQRDIDGAITYWNGIDWQASTILVTATGTTSWTYGPLDLPLVEGEYNIESHATDKAGNMENTFKLKIVFDKTIPTVDLSINPGSPNGDNDWYDSEPEITLSANDNSNLDRIEYQIDSQTGAWNVYSSPVEIEDGEKIFYYRSWDKAGNVSDIGEKNVKVDTEDPEDPNDFDAEYRAGSQTVRLSWDADSDVDKFYLYRGGSRDFDVAGRTRIAKQDGNDDAYNDDDIELGEKYYYKIVARDEAGNSSDAEVISIEIPENEEGEAVVVYEGVEPIEEGDVTEEEDINVEGEKTEEENLLGDTEGASDDEDSSIVKGDQDQNQNQNNWKVWVAVILLGIVAWYFYQRRNKKK